MSNNVFNNSDDKDKSSVYSSERSHLHRESVRDNIETSTTNAIIKRQQYTEQNHSYNNTEKAVQSNPVINTQGSSIPSNRNRSERPATYSTQQTQTYNASQRQEQSRPTSSTQYNNAERSSHKNNVETLAKTEARYGSIETVKNDTSNLSGAGAGAASISTASGIFKNNDNGVFKGSINSTASDTIRSSIKSSQGEGFAQKTWGKSDIPEKKGIVSTTAGIIGREIDKTLGSGGSSGNIDERAKGQAQKFGYKTGKFAVLGGASVTRGSFRIARYGKKLSNDVAGGVLTSSQAKKLLSGQLKTNMLGAGVEAASILKTGTLHVVADFKGSDDLGMQAITKPKDLVVGTSRSFKMAKATGRTVKKTFATTKSALTKIQQGGRAAFAAGKKLLSNPIVLKGIGIVALAVVVVAVVISVVSSVTSMFPALSLKSEDYELSQTYLYITELDARMEDDIFNEDTKLHIPSIDEYHYYLNGALVSKSQMSVYTNADLVLAYLDSKYEDYAFDGIIAGLFGTTVKGEIEEIHSILHQVNKTRWTETIEHTETYPDEYGVEITYTWYEYIYHMDISLTTKTWETYYEENKSSLLTHDQQQMYDALIEVGVYAFKQQLSSPFVGTDWSVGVSSRWGWRIHPITGVLSTHKGLDIAMPGGTPINACNSGTVSTGNDPDGWGNYIKVTMSNGDYTLYAHMSGFAVSNGQTVNAGDVIGYVGTTGSSTGNHLHLEYYQNGKSLNPLIFTECETTP